MTDSYNMKLTSTKRCILIAGLFVPILQCSGTYCQHSEVYPNVMLICKCVAAACNDYIAGTPPFCGGRSTDCRQGYHYAGDITEGCWWGNKVKCVCNDPNCNPCQDYVEGTGPFCAGGNHQCRIGWERAYTFKDNCVFGSKTYCRCIHPCLRHIGFPNQYEATDYAQSALD